MLCSWKYNESDEQLMTMQKRVMIQMMRFFVVMLF